MLRAQPINAGVCIKAHLRACNTEQLDDKLTPRSYKDVAKKLPSGCCRWLQCTRQPGTAGSILQAGREREEKDGQNHHSRNMLFVPACFVGM